MSDIYLHLSIFYWTFRFLWFQVVHTLDHLWFQAVHTLDNLWFQADHGKIIVRKFVWFVWWHGQIMIGLVGKPNMSENKCPVCKMSSQQQSYGDTSGAVNHRWWLPLEEGSCNVYNSYTKFVSQTSSIAESSISVRISRTLKLPLKSVAIKILGTK